MAVLFDAVIIVILLSTCLMGYFRGFVKNLIGMIAAALAVLIAAMGAGRLAEFAYDRYARDTVNKELTAAAESFEPTEIVMQELEKRGLEGYVTDEEIRDILIDGGDYAEQVSELLDGKGADGDDVESLRRRMDKLFGGGIPEDVKEELEKAGLSKYVENIDIPVEEIREFVSAAASGDKERTALYIADNIVRPIAVGALRSIAFIACYLLAMLAIHIVILITGVMQKIPELKAADRFAGLALGALKGLVYCAVIAWALSAFCTATKDSLSVLNSGVIDETYLMRLFFGIFYK